MGLATAKYVYGVVPGSAVPPSRPGIAGASLELIAGDGVAAIVSDLADGELRMGTAEMTAHSEVLEDALALGTVLPMRFGVVMAGDAAVRSHLLDAHRDELGSQLEQLEGKVELSVRATYELDALMREIVNEDQDVRRLRGSLRGAPDDATYYGRIELGEMVGRAIERKRESDQHEILAVLAPLALDVRVATPSHERIALSASFLVDRERMEQFDAAVERAAAAQPDRVRFKYLGPLPPHSFVELAGEV